MFLERRLLLLQCSLLPGGIILQGVLLLQGSMSVFVCQGGGVLHKLLMFLTWMGSVFCLPLA
jgi:hypothetical protein